MLKIIILCFLIIILFFIVRKEHFTSAVTNSSLIIVDKDIKVNKKVSIDDNPLTPITKNDINDNLDGKIYDSDLVYEGQLNLSRMNGQDSILQFGNKLLNAQDIRNMKRYPYPRFVNSVETYLPGTDYPLETPEMWESVGWSEEDLVTLCPTGRCGDKFTDKQKKEAKKLCEVKGSEYKYNEEQANIGVNNSKPGCGTSLCCKKISDAAPVTYDQLCISNTCINGEDLKILKSQKMFSIKSQTNNNCINYPLVNTKLDGWGMGDWGPKIRFSSTGSCGPPSDSTYEKNQFYRMWPGPNTRLNSRIL